MRNAQEFLVDGERGWREDTEWAGSWANREVGILQRTYSYGKKEGTKCLTKSVSHFQCSNPEFYKCSELFRLFPVKNEFAT